MRQSAKLHFREEDFLKKRLEKELSSPTIAGDPADDANRKASRNGTATVKSQLLQVDSRKKAPAAPFALDFPAHMAEGQEFHFRVTVQQAFDVSSEYADVFCQFKSVAVGS